MVTLAHTMKGAEGARGDQTAVVIRQLPLGGQAAAGDGEEQTRAGPGQDSRQVVLAQLTA
jgi:hypothetical protein